MCSPWYCGIGTVYPTPVCCIKFKSDWPGHDFDTINQFVMNRLPFLIHGREQSGTRKIVEGTRGPFYTIDRSFLLAADTLT